MSFANVHVVSLALAGVFSWIVYIVIYRIFFHPLSAFPGPKLAVATYAYEWYYDLILRGQYTFKLRELHKEYGPVIRLNPDELHIDDPDYYDEIFDVTGGKVNKPYRAANAFGPYPAAIGTADHDIHRVRRGALNPFFSKRLVFEKKVIPAGTVVCMTPLHILMNEHIFPDPQEFRPERWLNDERLSRYLVAFSRGTRSCLGISLAWAELYLVLAKVFRKFNFDVDQVVRERDIDVARDVLLGVPRSDSIGVIVNVLMNND